MRAIQITISVRPFTIFRTKTFYSTLAQCFFFKFIQNARSVSNFVIFAILFLSENVCYSRF